MAEFRVPGPSDRLTVIGPTGCGKTVLAAWILSLQNFEKRPWVALDFKGEELWQDVGDPPMRTLKLGSMPGKRGLYRLPVRPGQEEELEAWLWRVWERGNIGLFVDEVSLVPQKDAFKAILRQGRSLLIPVISCTQRPVDCDREVFSEAQFICVFEMSDVRDFKTIEGFTNKAPVSTILPERYSHWIDRKKKAHMVLRPCPAPDIIAKSLQQSVPYSMFWG